MLLCTCTPLPPSTALCSVGKSMKYTVGCGRAAAGAAQARPGGHGDRVTNIMGELSIIFGCSTKCTSSLCWEEGRCGPCQCNNGAMVPSIKVSSVAASCSSRLRSDCTKSLRLGSFKHWYLRHCVFYCIRTLYGECSNSKEVLSQFLGRIVVQIYNVK